MTAAEPNEPAGPNTPNEPAEASKSAEASKPVLNRSSSITSVAWSAVSVGGRQVFQLLFAIILANILGPTRFGTINAATVYVVLAMILLDQGLASGVIQRRSLSARLPGATMTVNLLMAAVLGIATIFAAPFIADFFHADALAQMLPWLGAGLLLKALTITPRALLARDLRFRPIGLADALGTAIGSAAGIAVAFAGLGEMSLVVQVLTMDAATAAILILHTRGPWPNLALREIVPVLPYSLRVFGTTIIAFIPRNIDNILIGHFLGTKQLALYGVGYRMLGIPVQLLGQTARRVLFPAFSRMNGDRQQGRVTILQASRWLALVTVPLMSLMAVSAWQLIPLIFGGDAWLPAAPLVAILALAGAREAIFYPVPALMNGFGRADMALRFEWVSTTTQVAAILIGLPFGILGVASCYFVAGLLLIPVLLFVQHRLVGVRPGDFFAAVSPALHLSLWGAGAYALISWVALPQAPRLVVFVVGSFAFVLVAALVLTVAHRKLSVEALSYLSRGRHGRHRTALASPGGSS